MSGTANSPIAVVTPMEINGECISADLRPLINLHVASTPSKVTVVAKAGKWCLNSLAAGKALS